MLKPSDSLPEAGSVDEPWPPTARAERRLQGRVQNVLLVALGFALLGHAIWKSRGQIREVFAHDIDGRLFLAAFAIYLTAMLLTFLRWHQLVRVVEPSFRLNAAVLLGFIGTLYNLVIPGAVGGDLIKAAYLAKMDVRRTQAIASLVIDRVIGLLGLFMLAGIAGATAWPVADGPIRRLILVVWVAVAIGFVGLAMIFNQDSLARRIPGLLAGRGRVAVILGELEVMASTYRRRLGLVAGALCLSSLIQACTNVLAFYSSGPECSSGRHPHAWKTFVLGSPALFHNGHTPAVRGAGPQ